MPRSDIGGKLRFELFNEGADGEFPASDQAPPFLEVGLRIGELQRKVVEGYDHCVGIPGTCGDLFWNSFMSPTTRSCCSIVIVGNSGRLRIR